MSRSSRTSKLAARLAELEREYIELAIDHFWNLSLGYVTIVLSKKIGVAYRLRFPSKGDKEALQLFERLEKEIETLRSKLNAPASESPVQVVREFADRIRNARSQGEDVRIAKEFLRLYDAEHPNYRYSTMQ